MKSCPEGTVWSSDSKTMADAGYNVSGLVYPKNICLPMPCKWFFEENGRSFYNNKNSFTQNGCVCDVSNGWIPTMTKHSCVPLFENSKSLSHSAATLKFVKEPQTLHQYVYTNNISPLAKHITDILKNVNTKEASKNFSLKYGEKGIVVAGEFETNSFNFASKNAKKILKAISMHGVLSDDYYDMGKINQCSHDKKSLFCKENNFLVINEAIAFAQAMGGIYWEQDKDILKICVLSQKDSMKDIELKYNKH